MKQTFRMLIFCAVLNGIPSANPISIFEIPVITEVYRVSPEEWYIEIDGTIALDASGEQHPCTSTEFLLVVVNNSTRHKQTYETSLEFNDNGYAVISQSSILKQPNEPPVRIGERDQISIGYNDSWEELGEYWQFQLRETAPGNELVLLGDDHVYETSRRSLGSRGQYDTRYEFTLLDSAGNTLNDIWTTLRYPTAIIDSFVYDSRGMTGENGYRLYQASLGLGDDTVEMHFSDYKAGQLSHVDYGIPPRKCTYSETIDTITDSIIVSLTNYELTVLDENRRFIPRLRAFRTHCNDTKDECDTATIPGEYDDSDNWTGATSRYKIRVHEAETPVTISFYSLSEEYPHTTTYYNEAWTGIYRTSGGTIPDTLIVTPCPVAQKNLPGSPFYGQGRFNVLPDTRGNIRIILVAQKTTQPHSLTLYTLSGEKLLTRALSTLSPGTHTVLWQTGKETRNKIPAGSYICALERNGRRITSRKVTLR